jgi:UDP-glucose 4-epimerase
MMLANSSPLGRYEVFNVATEDYISVKDIAKFAIGLYGLSETSVKLEFTGGDRGWKGDVPMVRLDTEKIRSIGWKNKKNSSRAMIDSMACMIQEIKS